MIHKISIPHRIFASVANPSAKFGFRIPTLKSREQNGNNKRSYAFPAVTLCTYPCELSPAFLSLRHLDTEEVDGSSPFGPTISRFSPASSTVSIQTDTPCAGASQNLLSEISGPAKDFRTRAPLVFHHLT